MLISRVSYSQTDNEVLANEKLHTAIELMDSGQIDESIRLLDEAEKLDPGKYIYRYETAFAYYLKKDYKKAVKLLEELTQYKDVTDLVYQMLGNAYDMWGKTDKALEAYNDGLKIFPNSGKLYLEQGIISVNNMEYDKAVSYFQKGTEVDPNFPSNYYHLAKLYINSTEEVWGMINGEIFMNLERNSRRTQEISKLLFNTYKSEIKFVNDTSFSVSFCQNMTLSMSDISSKDFKMPFGMLYESVLGISVVGEKSIDMSSLDRIRTNFLNTYFDSNKGYNKQYPNDLFNYQKKVQDAGHLEAYNHWILMKGDEDAFGQWYDQNLDKWNAFIEWFKGNGMVL